jgi:hypothetical protein
MNQFVIDTPVICCTIGPVGVLAKRLARPDVVVLA